MLQIEPNTKDFMYDQNDQYTVNFYIPKNTSIQARKYTTISLGFVGLIEKNYIGMIFTSRELLYKGCIIEQHPMLSGKQERFVTIINFTNSDIILQKKTKLIICFITPVVNKPISIYNAKQDKKKVINKHNYIIFNNILPPAAIEQTLNQNPVFPLLSPQINGQNNGQDNILYYAIGRNGHDKTIQIGYATLCKQKRTY